MYVCMYTYVYVDNNIQYKLIFDLFFLLRYFTKKMEMICVMILSR